MSCSVAISSLGIFTELFELHNLLFSTLMASYKGRASRDNWDIHQKLVIISVAYFAALCKIFSKNINSS